MTDLDPYAPFDRCGWTVTRSRYLFSGEPGNVRVTRDVFCTYLRAVDYASFDGDDAAFVGLMAAMREDHIRTNLLSGLPADATISIERDERKGTTIVRAEWMEP